MQPMLEPSFSNSLLPLTVSAFKHRLCTALARHQHSGLSVTRDRHSEAPAQENVPG